MLFGNKIKELRDKNGVLQRQLAAHLEMDTPLFSKIERGARFAQRVMCFCWQSTSMLADKMIYAVKGEKKTK